MFHSENLLSRVLVIGYEYKFVNLRSVNLLRLATNKLLLIILLNDYISIHNTMKSIMYLAISIAAVPTNCNFPLRTAIWERNRSI